MKSTAGEIARAIGARLLGDAKVEVYGVASITAASAGDLVFVDNPKHLASALQSAASAVIVGDFANAVSTSKPLLVTANSRLAFTRAAVLVRERQLHPLGIHPASLVHASAKLGERIAIEARVILERDVSVGNGTWIGSGSVIGNGVIVGENCEIYPNVTVYPGTRIGDRVTVHAGAVLGSDGFGYVRESGGTDADLDSNRSTRYIKFPQIGKLDIEDDVEIGANATIDRGALDTTHIGRGTKIDNLVHIGHNCRIGENVIIAAQAGFSGSIVIEDNVVIGGQVGVGEHAHISEGVLLGGQSGVLPKKILRGRGVAFWGTPAKPLREYLKSLAGLARLGKKD